METKLNIAQPYQQYADFIAGIIADFDRIGTLIYNSRNQLRTVKAPDGSQWIVKRYKRPNIFQRADYRITQRSKATKAFQAATALTELGLATPEAIAAIDCTSRAGGLERCYFISAFCDFRQLYEELAESSAPSTILIDAAADLLIDMHRRGVVHGDLNIRNILVNPGTGAPLYLIDNNRIEFLGRALTKKERINNLVRLTHERPVMHAIVAGYANRMNWDSSSTINAVERKLHRFERSRALRHRFKRLLRH